jgi:hypothetical protein
VEHYYEAVTVAVAVVFAVDTEAAVVVRAVADIGLEVAVLVLV